MDLGIQDKIALVTGGSTGIGYAAAEALAAEGATVILNSRSEDNLKKAVAQIKAKTGQDAEYIAGDLTMEGTAERIVKEVEAKHGRIDIMLSNAGGPPAGMFLDLPKEAWKKSVDLTFYPSLDLTRAVLPGMKERKWGRIIYLTSLSVKQPVDNLIISNSYRAGLAGFSKTISNQFAGFGITVNMVCPGYTNTERLTELAENISSNTGMSVEEVFKNWAESVPAGRIGEPSELGAVIAFIASEKASYVTGTVIQVDGGCIKSLL